MGFDGEIRQRILDQLVGTAGATATVGRHAQLLRYVAQPGSAVHDGFTDLRIGHTMTKTNVHVFTQHI